MIDKEKEELIVMWEIGFDRNQPICFQSNRDVQKEERKKKTINDIRYNEWQSCVWRLMTTMMKMDSWQWTLGCSGGAGQAGAIAKTFNLQVISLDDDDDY